MVGTVIGSYQLVRKIGEGGMGTVYLGQHTLLGRRAAIKVLLPMLSARPDIVNRFFNEARATTSISDPGIVQIFDFGYHTDGSAYIVMEYLEGEPLDARLTRLGCLPVVDALRLMRQVSASLGAAHAQNIVHRDLKPENIYLVRDGEVTSGERAKILDFGIAKLSDDHPGKVKTHTGALMGTPIYMSPEQCRGASELDHRSDIYAVGCVLFRLITGAPPFDGEGMGEIIAAHLREPPPVPSSRLPGISPAVDALILRCLEKRPDDRFASMAELVGAIGRLLPYPTAPDAATHMPPYLVGHGASSIPSPTPPPMAVMTPVPPVSTPTTLGASAGQLTTPAPPTSRWLAPLLAVGFVAAGAVALTLALRKDPAPASAPAPEAPVVAATPDAASPPDAPSTVIPVTTPVDAAIDAAVDGPPDAPVDAPAKRHRSHRSIRAGGNTGSTCNRAVDNDCDGIPDVR